MEFFLHAVLGFVLAVWLLFLVFAVRWVVTGKFPGKGAS